MGPGLELSHLFFSIGPGIRGAVMDRANSNHPFGPEMLFYLPRRIEMMPLKVGAPAGIPIFI
jgi:hypothetical protein